MNTLRIVLVCALAAATAAGSRAQAKPTAVMTSRGGFFALSVADMKASGVWYVEKLGLAVAMEEAAAAGHPGVTVLEGGGLIVELIQNADATPHDRISGRTSSSATMRGI
jgi:hypothetical protein